jgi:RNA polymerase sigma factor (sigma-70 family)
LHSPFALKELNSKGGAKSSLQTTLASLNNFETSTISAAAIRLQNWMGEPVSAISMFEQDRQISDVIAEERARLRNFIRRRVPDEADVEDLLQEVFYELLQAHRLLKPIDYVTGWLYRVARNRITDLFRKRKPETFADATLEDDEGELLRIEDLLPSSDAGPEALYVRNLIFDELEAALGELPTEQREVFIAHELEGRSFRELSEESGINVNTLLARKRYAVLHLRERMQSVHNEITRK